MVPTSAMTICRLTKTVCAPPFFFLFFFFQFNRLIPPVNEEEQEVKRLQKEKLSSLQQEDFELSDSFNKRSKQPTKKMAPSTVSSAPSSVTVEQIEEDLDGLTQDELLSIVQQGTLKG